MQSMPRVAATFSTFLVDTPLMTISGINAGNSTIDSGIAYEQALWEAAPAPEFRNSKIDDSDCSGELSLTIAISLVAISARILCLGIHDFASRPIRP